MAVYTHVSDEALSAFLSQYDVGNLLSIKGIAEGVENSNYLLRTDKASYILTLYEKRVLADDLPFFLGLMAHLAKGGIACPLPVADRQGNVLTELSGRPAALISFLEGMSVSRPTAQHCALVGEGLAQLHLAGAGFDLRRPNDLGPDNWRSLYTACKDDAGTVHRDLRGLLDAEIEEVNADWPTDLPAGVIHADLFPDNVFFLGDKLSGIIDFYFACNDFFAYDLAICMNAWCFEPDGAFNITKARQMLRAYRQVRDFSADELQALPMLARGAALRFLLTRLYDWLNQVEGALVKPKDPLEYMRKLRFHRQVKGPGEYGLD